MRNPVRGGRGFTLIETLIALVVAATAAAVILAQLRVLVARAEQERAHEMAVLRLLNESVRLSLGSPGASASSRRTRTACRFSIAIRPGRW